MTGVQRFRALVAAFALLVVLVGTGNVWAQGMLPIQVNQGDDFQWTVFPVERGISAESFYNYSQFDYQSRTFLEVPRQSTLFFYRDLSTGRLAMIIFHNAPNAGPGGQAGFDIQGLPSTAQLTLRDDPNDGYSFNPPNASFRWSWTSAHTDGVVINNLQDNGTITINPSFNSGISRWYVLTQKTPTSPVERVPLPRTSGPLTIQLGITGENYTPLFDKGDVTQPPSTLDVDFDFVPDPSFAMVPVRFTGMAEDATTPMYQWDFENDGTFTEASNSPFANYAFPSSGNYDVTLKVTDADGRTGMRTRTVEVLENQTTVVRTISTPQVKPESMFRVTLDLKVMVASNGLGVEEKLPSEWIVEPVRNDGAIYKFDPDTGIAHWLFPTLVKSGEKRRIVYDVRVPGPGDMQPPSLPRDFVIHGSAMSVSPSYTVPTLGEDTVEGASCLSMPVVFAHMDPITREVDLRTSEDISDEQVKVAIEFWQNDTVVPCTCENVMTTGELDHVVRHNLMDLPVDHDLPEPTSDMNFIAETVTRKITTPLPSKQVYIGDEAEGGNSFEVTLEIRAQRDLTGLIVTDQLFEGWTQQPLMMSGAVYKAKTSEWYFPMFIPAGQSKKVVYRATVPMDAMTGPAVLTGSSDSWLVTFVKPIEGEKEVNVIRCMSVHLAIAKLDINTREIDLVLDDRITREQSAEAFQLWLEDADVPGTCGQKLDLETLKEITNYQVTETPVEK